MQPTPNAPRRLGPTFHSQPFERLDFRAGGVEQQLDLVGNAVDFVVLQSDDLVSVVD